jgi:hypothetical protein
MNRRQADGVLGVAGVAGGGARLRLSATLAALLLASAGCAPTTTHLVSTHQYGQALCSVSERKAADPVRRAVIDATADAYDPRLFARVVTREEWLASFGDDPKIRRLLEKYALLFVGLEHNQLEISTNVWIKFVDEATPRAPSTQLASVTEYQLAEAFGETPAKGHVVGAEGRLGRLARALVPAPDRGVAGNTGSLLAGVFELATLGLVPFTELYPGKGNPGQYVGPSFAEEEAAAPAMRTTARGVVTTLAAIPQAWNPRAILVPRPKGRARIDVDVSLAQPNRAHRLCQDNLLYQLPLLPAPTFEESIARTFPLEHHARPQKTGEPAAATSVVAASSGDAGGGGRRSLREWRVRPSDASSP